MDAVILNAFASSAYLTTAFSSGETPLEHTLMRAEAIRTLLQEPCEKIIAIFPKEWDGESLLPENVQKITGTNNTASACFAALEKALPAELKCIVWLDIDAPFVSVALASYLLTLHKQTWADYTFADGFPDGYTPQIFNREILSAFLSLAGNLPWNRSLLFDTILVDINSFDIETEAASEDYALLRLSLTVDKYQNYILCRRIAEMGLGKFPSGAIPQYDAMNERFSDTQSSLLQTLLNDGDIRRTLPYYYYVQVTQAMGQKPYWLPWADTRWQPPEKPQEMSVELWSNMLQEIARFTPEAVITIGYRGEPALHGNIAVMLAQTMQYSGLQLYVETSGIGWSEEARKQLKQTECKAIIVELDAYKPEDYQKFRGIGMEEALSFIEEMRTVRKDLVYVQITRMQENEWDIQQFFKHWDAVSGVTPIIQKYNHFAAQLPDRKVADLTPLTRNPCWHLQRDMTVLYNGTVIRCYQDLNHEAVRGIVGEKPLEELWEAALEDYRLHVSENYPPLCKMCDEYYTFNA